jgi:hypothetical protein
MLGAFKSVETPIAPLPPLLIMFGAKLRPGLSAIDIASKIIARRSESGGKSGDVFADGPNVDDAMEVIRAQEFIDAIHNAVVNVVIPPGIALMAVGIDSTGMPVITHGATTTMCRGWNNAIIYE